MTKIYAGFECARLHWNGHDLLETTLHTKRMRDDYVDAIGEGFQGFREGLTPNADLEKAWYTGKDFPMEVIYDISHFEKPDHKHLYRVKRLLEHRPANILAVNEPSVEIINGRSKREMVAFGCMAMGYLNDGLKKFYTCDPIHRNDDAEYEATDDLVSTGLIDTVGINYYPHHAIVPLRDVLKKASARYVCKIAITETGWHNGHPGNTPWIEKGYHTKRDWLDYVLKEVEESEVPVEFVCWYPKINMPDWDDPSKTWDCGWNGNIR